MSGPDVPADEGRPYAEVIGDPIAQSKSPLIHNFWLEKLRIDAEYRACHVRPEELVDYFTARRADQAWRGCNVTVPHKVACLPLLDGVHRTAHKIGAANTVTRNAKGELHGRNTDVDGIARTLDMMDERRGRHVIIIGAGGAARAMCAAIAPLQPASVTIVNRSREKALELLAHFALPGEVAEFGVLPPADLIVNASPLGMAGQPPLEVSLAAQTSSAFVFDMVYAPLETELLRKARERGLRSTNGLTMLIEQAAVAFAGFFGRSAPRKYNVELRELLTR